MVEALTMLKGNIWVTKKKWEVNHTSDSHFLLVDE